MADNPTDYRPFAGWVVFPLSPADLASHTLCPACQSRLAPGTVCQICGLDLTNPATAELAALSTDAAALLDRRLDLIGRIRYETAQRLSEQSIPAAPQPTTVPIPLPVPAPAPAPVESPKPTTAPAPASTSTSTEPRRSSIQVALLIVGISLLSVAAIFFLVYAFINFGLVARSLIIGAITVASIVVASVLRHRRLPATAEGIAVFAVVLVLLDAWALRANDFFGLGSGDASVYWGWTLVIAAVLFVAWNRLSGIRTPSIVGFGVFAPGVGLLAGWFVGNPDDHVFATFATIALAGIVQRFAARPAVPERVISFATTTLALLVAIPAALFVDPLGDWSGAIALVILAAISGVEVAGIDWRGSAPPLLDRAFGSVFTAITGASLAGAVGFAAIRVGDSAFSIIAPVTAAAIVALALEAVARPVREKLPGLPLRVAAVSAAAVGAIALLFPATSLLILTIEDAVRGLTAAWTIGGGDDLIRYSPSLGDSAIAVGLVVVLVGTAWTAGRVIRRRTTALAWVVAIGALLVVPVVHVLWIMLALWLLLAVAALVALTLLRARLRPASRIPLVLAFFLALGLAYSAGWASPDTWAACSLVVICALLAARLVFDASVRRGALLGVAMAVAIVGAAATARNLAMPLHPAFVADSINAARAAGFVAILLLGFDAIVRSKKLSTLDRRVAFWIAVPTMLACTLWTLVALHSLAAPLATGLLLPEYLTSLVVSVFLLAALIAWTVAGPATGLRPERLLTSALIAPAVYWLVDSLGQVLPIAPVFVEYVSITAAVLTAAGSLLVATLRPGTISRPAVDVGIAIVAVPAVIAATIAIPTSTAESTWLVLELAAVAALLLAVSGDGLFGSASRRRHLGWLALALGTAGLWWRLGSDRVGALEPYVLPLAGVLMIVAALVWAAARRAGRRHRGAETSRVAPWLALAALLIAIVPLALDSAGDPLLRPLIVGGASAALALVGSLAGGLVKGSERLRPYLDVAAFAGSLGTLLVSVVRAGALLAEGAPDGRLDLWIAAGVIVLAVTAFGLSRGPGRGPAGTLRRLSAELLVGVAMLELLVFELPALPDDAVGFARAFVVVLVFCALHVAGLHSARVPLTARVGWASIAFAALVGIVALSTGALHRIEFVSVPVALALLATGGVRLRRHPAARSWAWLAPATIVLLVPSLVATAWDAPLWRLIGLGVVGIAVVVTSLLLRLQAPFLISVVVVVIHAIATFSPQIRAVYEAVEWWIWLAVGGIVIVAVSVRFEKSRQGVKRIVSSIAGLR